MDAKNYQELLSALTDVVSPLNATNDKTKTHLNIDVRTINIPTTTFKDLVVEGDANSKTIKFTMQRTFDDIDLSDKTIIIKYINAAKQGDWYKVPEIIADDELIQFTWLLNEHVASVEGIVNYIIEFSGTRDDLDYYWHTTPSFLKVEKGLDVDDHIVSAFPSVLQDHELRLSLLQEKLNELLSGGPLPIDTGEIGDVKSLETDSKQIVGAINEIKQKLDSVEIGVPEVANDSDIDAIFFI